MSINSATCMGFSEVASVTLSFELHVAGDEPNGGIFVGVQEIHEFLTSSFVCVVACA